MHIKLSGIILMYQVIKLFWISTILPYLLPEINLLPRILMRHDSEQWIWLFFSTFTYNYHVNIVLLMYFAMFFYCLFIGVKLSIFFLSHRTVSKLYSLRRSFYTYYTYSWTWHSPWKVIKPKLLLLIRSYLTNSVETKLCFSILFPYI